MFSRRRAWISGITLGLAVTAARADISMPAIFSDHMVLLREARVPVWGKAEVGEKVTVSFGGQMVSTEAGADGRWRVELKGLKASDTAGELKVVGKNEIVIRDVLVGEVWLCSGQSNMDFRIARTEERKWCGLANESEVIAAADRPTLRMFIADPTMKDEAADDVGGKWMVSSSETAGEFSAVAYFFGVELQQTLKVPMGLVVTSFGASTAQAWISPKALAANPALASMLTTYDEAKAAWDSGEAKTKYEAALKTWEEAAEKAKAENKPAPRKPGAPRDPRQDQHNPGVLHNGMLAPLAPYGIRGVIWYQGESNGYNSELYLELMRTLVNDWRVLWAAKKGETFELGGEDASLSGAFPFLSVQLANYRAPATQPVQLNSQIARVREAQLQSSKGPNMGLVTAVDIGDAKDVHPRNKLDVGRRLALVARAIAYGEEVAYSGPVVANVEVQGESIRVEFRHADGGLAIKGEELKGFAVQTEAGEWVEAKAEIAGSNAVVVKAASGPVKIRAVRYAWADNPPTTLYSGAGLPTFPFKTDELP